jgi:hypothetical protein
VQVAKGSLNGGLQNVRVVGHLVPPVRRAQILQDIGNSS